MVPKDGKPLFFAGLSNVRLNSDHPLPEGTYDGFVIVTDASSGGMVDVHDRRPLAFRADEAQEWLDPSIDFERASHLANNAVTRSDAFTWFRVSTDVNKVGNNEARFNEPHE
ncbi:SOS response-associated peptidase family protein [Robbsia sp. Bb-Pol-6]|uniref:Abasic site processing protein n=1 Tax=Robbsia betulipollinis TaxID=2981849 RepID=A0ABT3ZN63_9BURK|nr:SOS response-associated peptidase family protein [Robbsia betulipollinis]